MFAILINVRYMTFEHSFQVLSKMFYTYECRYWKAVVFIFIDFQEIINGSGGGRRGGTSNSCYKEIVIWGEINER